MAWREVRCSGREQNFTAGSPILLSPAACITKTTWGIPQRGKPSHSSFNNCCCFGLCPCAVFCRATACHEWFISQILALSALTAAWVRWPPKWCVSLLRQQRTLVFFEEKEGSQTVAVRALKRPVALVAAPGDLSRSQGRTEHLSCGNPAVTRSQGWVVACRGTVGPPHGRSSSGIGWPGGWGMREGAQGGHG